MTYASLVNILDTYSFRVLPAIKQQILTSRPQQGTTPDPIVWHSQIYLLVFNNVMLASILYIKRSVMLHYRESFSITSEVDTDQSSSSSSFYIRCSLHRCNHYSGCHMQLRRFELQNLDIRTLIMSAYHHSMAQLASSSVSHIVLSFQLLNSV